MTAGFRAEVHADTFCVHVLTFERVGFRQGEFQLSVETVAHASFAFTGIGNVKLRTGCIHWTRLFGWAEVSIDSSHILLGKQILVA